MSNVKNLAERVANGVRLNKRDTESAKQAGILNNDGSPNNKLLDDLLEPKEQTEIDLNLSKTVAIVGTLANDSDFNITEPTLPLVPPVVTDETRTPVDLTKKTPETPQIVTKRRGRLPMSEGGKAQPTTAERIAKKRAQIAKNERQIQALATENRELKAEILAAEQRNKEQSVKEAARIATVLRPENVSLMTPEQRRALLESLMAAETAEQASVADGIDALANAETNPTTETTNDIEIVDNTTQESVAA